VTSEAVERIEAASPLRRGVTVWYGAFGSLGAWTVHLVFEASFVHWTAVSGGWHWALHAVTAICIAATLLAMALAWRLRLVARGADESSEDDAGQLLFLANLGLLFGAIDLALIVIEGAYAVVLYQPHALR
jgi:hypothetical protein